jgi:SAM-dependent methyltransferase
MAVIPAPPASWPLSLPKDLPAERVDAISSRVNELAEAAQYGWGHTIDFGPFTKRGLMGKGYLRIAGALDAWDWWPKDLTGLRVADIGSFTGGLSMYLAARGPSVLYAVDELGDHLEQCGYLAEVFGLSAVRTVESSLYRLDEHVAPNSLDLILLSGVLYHLSDMLVGIHMMRHLLAPGGVLIIETNAVDDVEHSYANFGRFYKGMWWQPSGLCIEDMCEFMGFDDIQVRFYEEGRCLVRCVRSAEEDIPFKRGMNWQFPALRDARPRTTDESVMAPVPRGPARQDAAAERAELAAVQAKLDRLEKSRAMRAVRGYWTVRRRLNRAARRLSR